MLMSAGIPLPRQVMGHGWISFKGEKLSKSLGNILEPLDVTKDYGPDPIRYYLLKEVPFERDGDFTWELFIERYNTELANDLGNLVSRSVAMAVKYFDGELPLPEEDLAGDLAETAEQALAAYREAFENHATHEAIQAAWTLVRRANQFIEERAPWNLAKDPASREELAQVMNALYESVRIAGILLTPVMPRLAQNIRRTINQPLDDAGLRLEDAVWNPRRHRPGQRLTKPSPLVPRIQADD
jgi:methionyl-tRNA synthetase